MVDQKTELEALRLELRQLEDLNWQDLARNDPIEYVRLRNREHDLRDQVEKE